MPTDRLVGPPRSKLRKQRTACRPRKLVSEMLETRVLLAQTTGLFFNTAEASDGYVLFSPNDTDDTYLIDKEGTVVNEWNFNDGAGLLGYLLEDGSVVRAASAGEDGQGGNGKITAAGAGGRLEHVDWDGNLLWSFDYGIADTATDTRDVLQHHDFEVLPNGNILMIAWEYKTRDEAIQAGRNPATVGTELFPDHIVEVDPGLPVADAIVWEWHLWDHLVQDINAGVDNFGVVAEHPEKVDINYTSIGDEGGGAPDDWTHANGIDYNPELDQIVLSVREFSEFWIIDHDTTTEEAAGPAGDLLYRWGNPQAYGAGDESDRVLFYQHDAKWVTDDSPGAGNITVFNNGFGGPADPDVSMVVEITPPVDEFGNYPLPAAGVPHGPAEPTWTYTGPEENFAAIISGTQRLENGNTLVTYGVKGTFTEVTPDGEEVWKYVSPYTGDGILGPEDEIPNQNIPLPLLDSLFENFVFRAIHYPVDYAPQFEPAVTGRHVFYNQSGHDDNTAGIDPSDAAAIAPDKFAYRSDTGLITSDSITSYSRGINGIFVDLAIAPGTLGLGDFEFKMSGQDLAANNSPGSWLPAPPPSAFTVLADTPSPGTDRVEFIWDNNAIENRYLEVTVKGNDAAGGLNTNTGLASTERFYFGNRIGNTFATAQDLDSSTTNADEVATRNNQGVAYSLANAYDFNKDFSVDATDQIIARNNQGSLTEIEIITAIPSLSAALFISGDDGNSQAIVSAPAVSTPEKIPSRLTPGGNGDHRHAKLRRERFGGKASPREIAVVSIAEEGSGRNSLDDGLLEPLFSSIGRRGARFRGRR